MTDADRVVSWDLRTGTYGKDKTSPVAAALAEYSTKESAGVEKQASGQADFGVIVPGLPPESGAVRVSLDASTATFRLSPYLPGLGWAEAGTTWAGLSQFSASYAFQPGSGVILSTVEEPSAAYSLVPEGGRPRPLVGGNLGTDVREVDTDGDHAVFTVPVGTTAGTFVFAPQAPMQVVTAAGDGAATWTTRPKPISIRLSLT